MREGDARERKRWQRMIHSGNHFNGNSQKKGEAKEVCEVKKEDMRVAGVMEGNAVERKRWKRMIHCGNLRREQSKEEKNIIITSTNIIITTNTISTIILVNINIIITYIFILPWPPLMGAAKGRKTSHSSTVILISIIIITIDSNLNTKYILPESW